MATINDIFAAAAESQANDPTVSATCWSCGKAADPALGLCAACAEAEADASVDRYEAESRAFDLAAYHAQVDRYLAKSGVFA